MPEWNRRVKIGVIGCGHMGASMVRGIVERSHYPQHAFVYDRDAKKTLTLKKEMSVRVFKSARQVVSVADVVILAVKPNVIEAVLEEIGLSTPRTTLVLSIAAGIPLSKLQKPFKEKVPVVRVMPNMPAQIGEGMSAYCLGSHAGPIHQKMTEMVLRAIGDVVEVKENLMDLVTGLSGSGPAYFFLFTEHLIEAACELGLKASVAKKLVYQTALGSAKTLTVSDKDPDVLIQSVASKGGTTEAALNVFRRKGLAKIIYQAVEAAQRRSAELSAAGD